MFNTAAFVIYILITAFTPGPNNIMAMSTAARLGFKKSWYLNLGMFISFSIIMVLCAVFTSYLYNVIPGVKTILTILGAAYILVLAWNTFNSASSEKKEETNNDNSKKLHNSPMSLFWDGFILQFVNPKIFIYGITSMSTYILPCFSEIPVIVAFAFVLSGTGSLSNCSWALAGSLFHSLFSKHTKIVNTILALLLVYCAIALFI